MLEGAANGKVVATVLEGATEFACVVDESGEVVAPVGVVAIDVVDITVKNVVAVVPVEGDGTVTDVLMVLDVVKVVLPVKVLVEVPDNEVEEALVVEVIDNVEEETLVEEEDVMVLMVEEEEEEVSVLDALVALLVDEDVAVLDVELETVVVFLLSLVSTHTWYLPTDIWTTSLQASSRLFGKLVGATSGPTPKSARKSRPQHDPPPRANRAQLKSPLTAVCNILTDCRPLVSD